MALKNNYSGVPLVYIIMVFAHSTVCHGSKGWAKLTPSAKLHFMLARLLGFTLGNKGGLAPKIDST